MNGLKRRYELTPQMREYDKLGITWLPYLMHFHPPNHVSKVVNTDSRGFRHVVKDGAVICDFRNEKNLPVGLVVGGSFAFGVGATDDSRTVPSVLNSKTGHLWFNFGGRAFNSTQELLIFLFNHTHFRKIDRVVILSGLNNLALFHMTREYPKELGTFFYNDIFAAQMAFAQLSARQKALGLLERAFKRAGRTRSGARPSGKKDDLLFVLERDMRNWKILSETMGFRLDYVLQPFANWVKKETSKEEDSIFSILDKAGSNTWNIFKERMGYDQYLWFSGRLGSICENLGVRFCDLNEALSRKKYDGRWLFVDRAHFNDDGYEAAAGAICGEVLR